MDETDHIKDLLCARIEELEKEKLELNEQLDALQEERDALAAQLDRPRIKMLGDLIRAGLEPDDIPASLARLKAQWQAEALEELLQNTSQFREANPVRGLAGSMADELRQQAEGGKV